MEINISNKPLLYRRVAIGATIAFVWTAYFLIKGGAFDPKWPHFWYIRPLILVPLAGAVGGVFYHLMEGFRIKGGWIKVGINLLCVIVYIMGVWIGTVLGLDGVWWD
ncbi:MAG TPA: hypothetical protein PLQ57_07405 [Saprospiraceae bacterium]|nr:hypothetical protein [Saprospiraceae bacterium]HRG64224.1 hypothetical protein [Saprospiraceae bacterium]